MSSLKKSYFGTSALVTGIISIIFAIAAYSIVFLDISPKLFFQLNNLTALVLCSLTPITIILGVLGLIGKNDNKIYSIIAISLVTLPTLALTISFLNR